MPRNRQTVDRSLKVEEILRVGERLIRSGGYEELSFGAVADELGVARGAVYWYFPSKDELFAACATRAIHNALSNPPARGNHITRIVWSVNQLAEIRSVHTTLQDRARRSDPAAELLEAIQSRLCSQLRDLLLPQVDAGRLESVTDAIFIFVQGLLGLDLSAKDRERSLRFLLDELLS